MTSTYRLRAVRATLACVLLACSMFVALKFRREVLWPRWVESKGGYVHRNHDAVVAFTTPLSLSMTRIKQLPDGTLVEVPQPAYFPATQLRQTNFNSSDLKWSVFSVKPGWEMSHVALPIAALDDATIQWLNSINSVEYVSVIGLSGTYEPEPNELRRLKEINGKLDAQMLCKYMCCLQPDRIVYKNLD